MPPPGNNRNSQTPVMIGLKILFNLTLFSLIVKERILSEMIFKAESFIGSKLILLELFCSGSRVKFD